MTFDVRALDWLASITSSFGIGGNPILEAKLILESSCCFLLRCYSSRSDVMPSLMLNISSVAHRVQKGALITVRHANRTNDCLHSLGGMTMSLRFQHGNNSWKTFEAVPSPRTTDCTTELAKERSDNDLIRKTGASRRHCTRFSKAIPS